MHGSVTRYGPRISCQRKGWLVSNHISQVTRFFCAEFKMEAFERYKNTDRCSYFQYICIFLHVERKILFYFQCNCVTCAASIFTNCTRSLHVRRSKIKSSTLQTVKPTTVARSIANSPSKYYIYCHTHSISLQDASFSSNASHETAHYFTAELHYEGNR